MHLCIIVFSCAALPDRRLLARREVYRRECPRRGPASTGLETAFAVEQLDRVGMRERRRPKRDSFPAEEWAFKRLQLRQERLVPWIRFDFHRVRFRIAETESLKWHYPVNSGDVLRRTVSQNVPISEGAEQIGTQINGPQCNALLDLEPIRPRDGHAEAALRLLGRMRRFYGVRFFDAVTLDGWYVQGPFLKAVEKLGWAWVVVLKQERMEVLQDARTLRATLIVIVLLEGSEGLVKGVPGDHLEHVHQPFVPTVQAHFARTGSEFVCFVCFVVSVGGSAFSASRLLFPCFPVFRGLRFRSRARSKFNGSRFKVQGSRFKVQGSRFKVQGSRFNGSRFNGSTVQGSGVQRV